MKIGNTSDEMVTLMRTGKYDGVSASGDATLRLIAGGDVAPVNIDLVPNYKDVFPALKNQPHNTRRRRALRHPARPRGEPADVEQGRGQAGARLVGRRLRRRSSPYKGKVTAYDSPIYIADAALYLKATQPDLGIDNVYELDDKQFNAAVDLLKKQREAIGEYWSDYTKEQAAFTSGDSVVGTTWQVIANLRRGGQEVAAGRDDPARRRARPGWSDTWMISSKAKHPNCMYMWMNHIISPEGERRRWPSGSARRRRTRSRARRPPTKNHCEIFHADDEDVLRPGGLLDDAAQAVRRRPRGHLQGLLRVGQGLDGDQGLRSGPAVDGGSQRQREEAGGPQAHRLPLAAPARSARAAAVGADGLAGDRLPGLARGAVRGVALAARHVQRRDRPQDRPPELQGAGRRRRSTARSCCARW